MKESELWNYFWTRRVVESKPLDRYFIWVFRKDFMDVQDQFKKEYNIFHPGKSYRSISYIKHLHAVDEGEYFCIHQDLGNIARFFPLGIIHFFFDVLPYLIFSYWKGIPNKSLTVFPNNKI
jgi:hypothetical protein